MPEPDKTKEYKQGRQARLDRKGLDSCPYGNKIQKTYGNQAGMTQIKKLTSGWGAE